LSIVVHGVTCPALHGTIFMVSMNMFQ
jgi:hypothetical protein